MAAGSVTGRDHRRAERDGQDGHAIVVSDELLAIVVTDGCSSGRTSEIGARIGAAWLATLIEQHFRSGAAAPASAAACAAVARVADGLLARLEVLARSLDSLGNVEAARVEEALLFTFLAVVVTPETTIAFGIGDGILLANGAMTVLDPGPRNAPPYVAYGLVGAVVEPRVHFTCPTAALEVVAIATDGLLPVGSANALTELAGDPRYAKNPSLLRKRLVVLSDRGTFSDDATLAVIRRRSAP